MCAAVGGHEAVAQLLLQHGADARAADNDGDHSTDVAAQGGHEAVAQLLLQHGADVSGSKTRWCHSIDVGCSQVAMRPWPSCCYSTVPMWRQQNNVVPQH